MFEVGKVCGSHDVNDSAIRLVCTVGCKLQKSCMASVPGLFSGTINRCSSARLINIMHRCNVVICMVNLALMKAIGLKRLPFI